MYLLGIEDILGEDAAIIADIVNTVILVIKWAVPALLVVMGGIDLGKAVMAGKDEEMKKAQGLLMKRIVAGVLVFLLGTIINIVINLVSEDAGIPDDIEANSSVEIVEIV